MNEIVIKAENLTKYYHRGAETVHALDGVTFEIYKQDYIGIIGHSGSGKTTLLNLLGCLDRPTSGTLSILGKRVENLKEEELNKIRRENIGFVFQQFFLISTLTVKENVELPLLFTKKTNNFFNTKELLKIVGLEKRADHFPNQLSGGEMQRVAIARSLITSPKIILADEPTGNLDSRNTKIIMEIFDKLNSEGKTIIFVTHNYELLKNFKRVIKLEDGKIIN